MVGRWTEDRNKDWEKEGETSLCHFNVKTETNKIRGM